jgi:beta-1,2-mannobiose phosphorylase / 1,2-beta-oligomannan phosphorylase
MNKIQVQRNKANPILIPDESNWWESKAVFNCGILHHEQRIHMLYRAIGEYEKYVSRLGYASSSDGFRFERSKKAAMTPYEEYEKYGIEDPRLVKVNRFIVLSYVVLSDFVGHSPIASTALATTNDFQNYNRLGIVTSKGLDNKDFVLFPQERNPHSSIVTNKIGRYLFLHRPSSWVGPRFGVDRPSIWLSEGNDLTTSENHTLLLTPKQEWEALKIGMGPPPIKTKKGWLLIYHGKDAPGVYRAGAALLDLQDPSILIGRTKTPILEPVEPYEKNGDVSNVVFPTGTCVLDGNLFIYYGAADKVCCLATVDLESLLDYILQEGDNR